MPNYKYYNYIDTGEDLTITPILNTHLFFELDTDYFYFVDTTQLKLYLFQISTGTETEIDIDPGDASGDNKSRIQKIHSAWHDRVNEIIYFVDCDNDGTADQFDVWTLDYSGSKTAPTVIEVGSESSGNINFYYAWDIFKIGSDIYVINQDARGVLDEIALVVWDVTSAPFTEIATDITTKQNLTDPYFGNVIGTKFYIPIAKPPGGTDDVYMLIFDSVADTISINLIDEADGYERPTASNLHGSSYDGSNNIYCVLYEALGGDNFLGKYSISEDNWTIEGIYDVGLMLDRNTDSAADPPFNIEKGFHISQDKVYQIPLTYSGKLNLISLFDFSGNISAITDHFVIAGTDVYQMVDLVALHYFSHLFLDYWKEDYPVLEMEFRRDQFIVSKNLFIQIIGKLTASYTNRIFKGTYLSDPTIGLTGTNIPFIDSIGGGDTIKTVEVITSNDGHRAVAQFDASGDNGQQATYTHNHDDKITGTQELWFKYIDNGVGLYQIAVDGTGSSIVIYIVINAATNLLTYYWGDGVGGVSSDTVALATDTWVHIKWTFDCGTDKFSLWVGEVFKVDDENFYADRTVADIIDTRILLTNGAGANTLQCFIDAFGESWDTDYTVGDNLYVEEGEPNKIVFEGIVDKYDGHKIQMVLVKNQGSEMDEVEPSGEFTVDTDGLISAIISGFHDYITEGTLQDGADLGTVFLKGNKKSLKIFNQMKDIDGYTWALQPQGVLDYNDGSIDSDISLQYETGVNADNIWDVDVVSLSSGTNQVIVKGALNKATGLLYTDTWNDDADQQANGIHKIIIFDALLNTNALCLAKATAIGTREIGNYLSVQCNFRNTGLGVIYPHQTLLFKYISEDVSISQAIYIIDGIGLDLLTEECFLQASAGLIFEYEAIEKELPEENSQKIEQNSETLVLVSTRIKDTWIPASGIKAPGGKPAAYISHGISGAWEFSDEIVANEETISANIKFKNDVDLAVAPTFCIGWSSTTTDADCYWQLEYLYTGEDDPTDAAAQETLLATADQRTSSSVAEGLVFTVFTLQVPSATDVCIHFRIKRRSASAEDTIADTVELHGIVLRYQADIIGTS